MSSGNGKNTVYVKKFADDKSVSVTAHAETWTAWDDSMLSAVEQAIQHYLAPKEASLKLPHAIVASRWIFQSKRTQLEEVATNGYPSVEIPDDDSDAETTATSSNSKRLRYFYWAQSVLHAVLLDSFKNLIRKFSRRIASSSWTRLLLLGIPIVLETRMRRISAFRTLPICTSL